jgi:hypothetical protein
MTAAEFMGKYMRSIENAGLTGEELGLVVDIVESSMRLTLATVDVPWRSLSDEERELLSAIAAGLVKMGFHLGVEVERRNHDR